MCGWLVGVFVRASVPTDAALSSRGAWWRSFWGLPASETLLLATVARAQPVSAAREIAVFLPETRPAVPSRLVMVTLFPGVDACVLCGGAPPLATAAGDAASAAFAAAPTTVAALEALAARADPATADQSGDGAAVTDAAEAAAAAAALPGADPAVTAWLLVDTAARRVLASHPPRHGAALLAWQRQASGMLAATVPAATEDPALFVTEVGGCACGQAGRPCRWVAG